MGEGADGRNERTGQTEIGQLQATITGDEDVLRFQISMHDPSDVAVFETFQHLVGVRLDELSGKRTIGGLEILLEILIDEFKYEVQTTFTLNDVTQTEE